MGIIQSYSQIAYTQPMIHSGDYTGHLGYIEYIYNHHWLPPPTGWQSSHPPLYYLISSIFYTIGVESGTSPMTMVRIGSCFLFYSALVFLVIAQRAIIKYKFFRFVALGLIIAWPSTAHFSVKITDDLAQLFFTSYFITFAILILNQSSKFNLTNLTIATAGAIGSKATGIIILIIYFLLLTYLFIKQKNKSYSFREISLLFLNILILTTSIVFSFGRIYLWNTNTENKVNYFINRHDDISEAYDLVSNEFSKLLYFDPQTFIQQPFHSLIRESASSSYFFHVFTKSIIYEIGEGNHLNGRGIAPWVNASFLFYLISTALLIILSIKERIFTKKLTMICIYIIVAFMAVFAGRISIPISNHGVVRFVYYISFAIITLNAACLSSLIENKKIKKLRLIFIISIYFLLITNIYFSLTRWLPLNHQELQLTIKLEK